jgi:hypothetical protein
MKPQDFEFPLTPIPGYSGYRLSADFKIIGKKGRPLTIKRTPCGNYQFVCVSVPRVAARNGKWLCNTTLYVHRAIALVHVAGHFGGAVVDHLDNNQENNHPSNLEWVTPLENQRRSFRREGRKTSGWKSFHRRRSPWPARLELTYDQYSAIDHNTRHDMRVSWSKQQSTSEEVRKTSLNKESSQSSEPYKEIA